MSLGGLQRAPGRVFAQAQICDLFVQTKLTGLNFLKSGGQLVASLLASERLLRFAHLLSLLRKFCALCVGAVRRKEKKEKTLWAGRGEVMSERAAGWRADSS